MGVETATKIQDLNIAWPLGTDPKSEGDDHIRLIKKVLKSDAMTAAGTRVAVFTASGTWTKGATLKFMEVTVVGGGGGGTGAGNTAAGQSSAAGAGGGAGTVVNFYAAADLPASVVYTVGAAGGIPGGSGAAGGTSLFQGMSGGGGGAPAAVSTGGSVAGTTPLFHQSGVGGNAFGGDINIVGGCGQNGMRAMMGSAITAQPGIGGTSFFTTAGDYANAQVTGSKVGTVGRVPGGGGGGGANGASQSYVVGAVGGAGQIIIKEFF